MEHQLHRACEPTKSKQKQNNVIKSLLCNIRIKRKISCQQSINVGLSMMPRVLGQSYPKLGGNSPRGNCSGTEVWS